MDQAVQILHNHQLFIKRLKCSFGASKVECLGHIVSWESLCGFLGLTSYYEIFVSNYGKMEVLLTTLLKKNAFRWNDVVKQAFQGLKYAMCTTLALTMLDFKKTFILECDASCKGIGAMLCKRDCHWLSPVNNCVIKTWAN